MIKFKTLLNCLLFIPLFLFVGRADLKIAAQNRISPIENGLPYIKCQELKNSQIDSSASDNKQVILIENDGNVRSLNNADLVPNWNIQLGTKLESIPYLHKSDILILSYTKDADSSKQQTIIRQINSLTGITVWITHLDTAERFSLVENNNHEKITLLSDKLNIRQIDSQTGKIIWKVDLKGELRTFTSEKNSLFILTADNKLHQLNIETGSIVSETEFKSENVSVILYIADSLLYGNLKGSLYKLPDSSKSESKLFRTGGKISFIESFTDNLLVVSNDNFLYSYSDEKQKVVWKKRLSGRVILKPVIYQDLIYVTTLVEPVIYVFNLTDGTLINQINLGQNYVIKDIEVYETGVNVLTTDGFLKLGISCQN